MTPFGEKICSLASSIRCEKIYFAPSIPQKKLRNLCNSCQQYREEVYALYDDTVWGGGADGMMLTDSGVWWHNFTEEKAFLSWDALLKYAPAFPEVHAMSVNITPEDKIDASESDAVYKLLAAAFRFKQEECGGRPAAQDAPAAAPATAPAAPVCMVECIYCGRNYDRSKGNCPGCGAPPER